MRCALGEHRQRAHHRIGQRHELGDENAEPSPSPQVEMKRALLRADPRVHVHLFELGAEGTGNRTVVGHRHDRRGRHPGRRKRANQAVGPSEGREQPEPQPAEGAQRLRPLRPSDRRRHRVDRHDVIRHGEQPRAWRAEIACRRETSAPPRAPGIDREERERARGSRNTQGAVEHEDRRPWSQRERMIDRVLSRRPDHHPHAVLGERARADDCLVADHLDGIVRRYDARLAERRTVRVPDEDDVPARARELAGAGDRDARLARASEGRSADADQRHVLRYGRAADEATRHERRGDRRGNGARDEAVPAARLERPRSDPGDRHARTVPPRLASVKALSARDLLDVRVLVDRQLEDDRARTRRFPALLTRKLDRMTSSPLAFLRGSAPLFYAMLAARPELAEGPPGEGWIVGDLHLENYGAYRPDSLSDGNHGTERKRSALFDLNDFDDTLVGPWRLDVLRLTTSLLLGGRELGASGVVALALVDRLVDAWSAAVFDDEPLGNPPAPVEALLQQVHSRTRAALLDARTEVVRGRRRFVRGPRYADLPATTLRALPRAFERYLDSVAEGDRPEGSFEILDAALRIAGTGSLGSLRIAVLVEGKGGPNGAWIFDLKEQGTPSASAILRVPDLEPAARVCTGFRACIEHPPRVMGTTRLGRSSMFGRRLAPQEDKLELARIRAADLEPLAAHLGALLGHAHRRGATKPARSRWSRSDRDELRRSAVTLAGLHEAVYLALCERARRLLS